MAIYRQSLMLLGRTVFRSVPNNQIMQARNIRRWVAPTLKELYRRRQKVGPPPPEPRSEYLEWNYDAELYAFGKRLGEDFDDSVLRQALTYKSYVHQQESKAKEKGEAFDELPSNQELIKRGNDLISEFLRTNLKAFTDDAKHAMHDYLTTEKMLAHVAKHIGLTDIILTTEFPIGQQTLSNTFKAVVAALEKSQNLEKANRFIDDLLCSEIIGKNILDIWTPREPYEYLKGLLKDFAIDGLEPRICNQSATNTILANYQVGLYTNNRTLLGIGWGESIQIAKDTAALDALNNILKKSK